MKTALLGSSGACCPLSLSKDSVEGMVARKQRWLVVRHRCHLHLPPAACLLSITLSVCVSVFLLLMKQTWWHEITVATLSPRTGHCTKTSFCSSDFHCVFQGSLGAP